MAELPAVQFDDDPSVEHKGPASSPGSDRPASRAPRLLFWGAAALAFIAAAVAALAPGAAGPAGLVLLGGIGANRPFADLCVGGW